MRRGGRASGDFNTGMGNTLVMLCVVRSVLRELATSFDALADGDNALVFLPGYDAPRVLARFHEVALRVSGHEMVLERPTRVLEEVRFGQSAPVEIAPGNWRMVRSWDKVLSQGTSTHVHLNEPRFAAEWLAGVATCEAFLGSGVPVLWAWANALKRSCGHRGAVREHPFRDYAVMGVPLSILSSGKEADQPTMECRMSFYRAFGLTVDDQLAVEAVVSEGFRLGDVVVREAGSFGPSDVWYGESPCADPE
jgi:hypothetical protein